MVNRLTSKGITRHSGMLHISSDTRDTVDILYWVRTTATKYNFINHADNDSIHTCTTTHTHTTKERERQRDGDRDGK